MGMTEKQCDNCKYYRKSDDYCYYRGYGSKMDCKGFERMGERMTEKRFKYVEFTKNVLSFDDNGVCRFFREQDFEDWLNELAEENQQYQEWLEALREELSLADRDNTALEKENKELKVTEGEMEDYLARMEEENKELQERNNRQAKQLGNIYHLIVKQDWKTLKGIIEEFKECEEQLQKEWSVKE